MSAGWTAATVRARGLARRRLGPATALRLAAAPSWAEAVLGLAGTVHGERTAGARSLAEAQRGISGTLLWHVRILAGWCPPGGTGWARCLMAGAERDNIVDHLRSLGPARPTVPEPLELGPLATAWPRLRRTATPDELRRELARSPWGDPGTDDAAPFRDVLTAEWLCRICDTVPPARSWARAAGALLAARLLLVGGSGPGGPGVPPRAVAPLSALLGRPSTPRSLDELVRILPGPVGRTLAGVTGPADLWAAEARLARLIDDDALRLLHGPRAGLDPVVGAIAVLAVDAWRLQAALAAAAIGNGPGEVLDAVA